MSWFHTAEALSIPYNGGMGSWVDPRAYLDIVARYKKCNFTDPTGNEPWPPLPGPLRLVMTWVLSILPRYEAAGSLSLSGRGNREKQSLPRPGLEAQSVRDRP